MGSTLENYVVALENGRLVSVSLFYPDFMITT